MAMNRFDTILATAWLLAAVVGIALGADPAWIIGSIVCSLIIVRTRPRA